MNKDNREFQVMVRISENDFAHLDNCDYEAIEKYLDDYSSGKGLYLYDMDILFNEGFGKDFLSLIMRDLKQSVGKSIEIKAQEITSAEFAKGVATEITSRVIYSGNNIIETMKSQANIFSSNANDCKWYKLIEGNVNVGYAIKCREAYRLMFTKHISYIEEDKSNLVISWE